MRAAFAPVAIALLVLAGCSSTPEATSPSASPSATETVSAEPSPSPSASPSESETAVATAECPTWDDGPDNTVAAIGPISFAGICIGQTYAEAEATGAPLTVPEVCPWVAEIVAMDDPGFYVSAYSAYEDPGEYISMFTLRWFADPAEAASFEMPRTAENITIGSTTAEVLAAYPTATEVMFDDLARGPRSQLIVPTTDTTTYNFDVVDGVVVEISWGEHLAQGGPNGDTCAL